MSASLWISLQVTGVDEDLDDMEEIIENIEIKLDMAGTDITFIDYGWDEDE